MDDKNIRIEEWQINLSYVLQVSVKLHKSTVLHLYITILNPQIWGYAYTVIIYHEQSRYGTKYN